MPLFNLYAKEPVALYTTNMDITDNNKTIPQMYLSPWVRLKIASLLSEANAMSFMLRVSSKKYLFVDIKFIIPLLHL